MSGRHRFDRGRSGWTRTGAGWGKAAVYCRHLPDHHVSAQLPTVNSYRRWSRRACSLPPWACSPCTSALRSSAGHGPSRDFMCGCTDSGQGLCKGEAHADRGESGSRPSRITAAGGKGRRPEAPQPPRTAVRQAAITWGRRRYGRWHGPRQRSSRGYSAVGSRGASVAATR
jgi:hypothetical protein